MPRAARSITVSLRQRAILMDLVEARSTPRGLAEQAAIVLASADGMGNEEQAQRLQRCTRMHRPLRDVHVGVEGGGLLRPPVGDGCTLASVSSEGRGHARAPSLWSRGLVAIPTPIEENRPV